MMNCVSCATANVDVKSIRHCQNEFFRIFSRKCFYRAILVLFFSFLLIFIQFIWCSKTERKYYAVIWKHLQQIYRSNCKFGSGKMSRHQCKRISYVWCGFFIFDFENAPIPRRLARKFLLFTVILMMFIFFCICFFFIKLLSHVIHAYGTWEMRFWNVY